MPIFPRYSRPTSQVLHSVHPLIPGATPTPHISHICTVPLSHRGAYTHLSYVQYTQGTVQYSTLSFPRNSKPTFPYRYILLSQVQDTHSPKCSPPISPRNGAPIFLRYTDTVHQLFQVRCTLPSQVRTPTSAPLSGKESTCTSSRYRMRITTSHRYSLPLPTIAYARPFKSIHSLLRSNTRTFIINKCPLLKIYVRLHTSTSTAAIYYALCTVHQPEVQQL